MYAMFFEFEFEFRFEFEFEFGFLGLRSDADVFAHYAETRFDTLCRNYARDFRHIMPVLCRNFHPRHTRVCLGWELVALIKCPLGRCGINTPTSVTTTKVSKMMSVGRGNISERITG